jgi:hypothetical protein
MDGQAINSDPVLAQAYEQDHAICLGERQKANLSGVTLSGGGFGGLAAQMQREGDADVVMRGCMAQRGYAYVPEAEAAAKLAQFRETAAHQQMQAEAKQPAPAKRVVTGSVR